MKLEEAIKQIRKIDTDAVKKSEEKWLTLVKPLFSLGRLENVITQIAGIKGSCDFTLENKVLVIMCADNGVVEEGISQCGNEVTAIAAKSFLRGESAACIMAKRAGVKVLPIDAGMVSDIENISDMRDEIKEYDNKLSACNERIKMLKENIGKAEKTDIEKLKADKEETENSLEEITEQKNSLTANISINKRIMDETQKLKTELEESGKRYSTYLNISQTANGELSKRQKIAFEQYIQSAYFRSILNEANKRFSYMTNGRFELVKHDGDSNLKSHSGLDIDVFDNYTGKQRSVKSLSGGESFKASLCMALGLSEVIQRNAGGVKLESMFVDEGFGVLDNESLEQAIEVLNSLSESDRMVGIISHISELKDRIDKKIVVKKGSAGSTVELIN